MEVLTDPYGRTVRSLRMSITDRCNLNCIYCHNEGHIGHSKEMSVDTIVNIVDVASQFGVNRLKLSGGEPLLRKDLEDALVRLPEMRDVSLTTNAVLLRDRASSLREAGLNRVNISLDTLDPEKYNMITNCGNGTFDKVLDGIHAAVDAGLTPVKLNMVLLKDLNDNEIADMLEFTRNYGGNVILQLIELMDFRDLPQYRINAREVEQSLLNVSSDVKVRELHKRKKYIIDGAEVEFVRPVDNTEFCANCNRLRVTADGQLKPCLLINDNHVDVANATREELPDLFRSAVSKRVPFCRN
ncbi:cyclic pyranopterin monophosphate synthase subunit MoaA [Methanolobus profundi]|uniref:Probable GTP 3',8-cyclase n=1 Tax=Methanolobus profundi TaxID=487685 RepID=A0A1I4UIC9_9EURY|nr:cyclic pyranopterin monophosphate synthase subunit MoaA [Methanolobus profundi]